MEQLNNTQLVPKIVIHEPPLYSVLFLDDPDTPMDFVVMLLEKHFSLDIGSAVDIMFQINDNGSSYVGAYTHDVAETILQKCWADISQSAHPLKIRTIPL